jgi:hypothetical protein
VNGLVLSTHVNGNPLTLPAGALVDDEWAKLSSEEVARKLLKGESPEGPGENPGGNPGDGENHRGGCSGVHEPPPDAAERGVDARSARSKLQSDLQSWQKRQQEFGSLPGNATLILEELSRPAGREVVASLLNWCEEVRGRGEEDWGCPDRRYSDLDLVLPTRHEKTMPPIVIAVDTSGSILGDRTLSVFGSAVKLVHDSLKPERLHVVWIDAAVHSVQTFEPGEPIELKPQGGGGTDFRPAFEWAKEHEPEAACIVYLTDLCGTFPESAPECPVLWVTTPEFASMGHPFGDKLVMEVPA